MNTLVWSQWSGRSLTLELVKAFKVQVPDRLFIKGLCVLTLVSSTVHSSGLNMDTL